MGLLDRFRGKEKVGENKKTRTEESSTELETFLGDDRKIHDALSNAMFLDPREIGDSMSEAAKKAKKFEASKDIVRAKIWYEIAGGLAIYEGDAKRAKEYFSKSQKISPSTKYPILKNMEDAVAKAQEYYEKHLKD